MTFDLSPRRRRNATAVGLTVGALAYLLTLVSYVPRLERAPSALGYGSRFFDLQGRAFLDGRLDVPRGSLSIEGFVIDGKEYTYFGPFPALLRMPVLWTTEEFDGRLTVVSMLIAFVILATMTARLVWLVRDMMHPDTPVSRAEAVVLGSFLAVATGGTSLTYAAGVPWVYHEVYAWSIAFAVGAMYWMLRIAREPTGPAIGWLLTCNLGAVLTRTTGGWAMCVMTVVLGVWLLSGRIGTHQGQDGQPDKRLTRRLGLRVVGGGVLALSVGIVYNVVKFRHPYLFPLEDQVWTEVNAHRREALAVNGGTITGPQFFPSAFMAYFRLDGLRLVDYFPYLTVPAEPARAYSGAFLDQTYRTGSVTAMMPWPLLLTVLATLSVFRKGVDLPRRMLRVPLVAGVLITGGVMAYGYLATRYTCEFVPALIIGGAIGSTVLAHWLRERGPVLRAVLVSIAVAGSAYGVVAMMILGYTSTALVGGGEQLATYLKIQQRLSPGAQQGLITRSAELPSGGAADDLWIQGDCDSLWFNSGDSYDEWLLVEARSNIAVVNLEPGVEGEIKLFTIGEEDPTVVRLEIDEKDRGRVVVKPTNGGANPGQFFDILEPRQVRVGVSDVPGLGYAIVSSTPGGYVGYAVSLQRDPDWVSIPGEVRPIDDATPLDGAQVTFERGLAPTLCDSLGDGLGADG